MNTLEWLEARGGEVKISDYLGSDVLLMLDQGIEYLENKIKDNEVATENLFATSVKDKELLAESISLRDKLYLVDLFVT